MDFVWIYVREGSYYDKAGWNELEYSIKSVRKNYRGDCKCWVVGDYPDGMEDLVEHGIINHLPCEQIRVHHSNLPQEIDVIKKFRAIIKSDVEEEFILMYDDIFLLQPLEKKDFLNYGYDVVEDVEGYIRKWSRSYKMVWKNTYRMIKEFRDDIYDWETHLPRLLEKEYFEEILNRYFCDEVPMIATSLYSARYGGETILMDKTTQYDLVQWPSYLSLEDGFKCKFLNLGDDAIILDVKERMKKEFG